MFMSFLRDEDGATAIEYALIAAIIGTGIVVSLTFASTELQATFQGIADHFKAINN